MKKYFLFALLFAGLAVSAQNNPKLEMSGNRVKATYFHDNGNIAQVGYFKDGKADGQWVAYDMAGNKKSIGEYTNGEKSGKWFFWNKENLSEVDYSNSRIAAVKNWKQETIAKN